MTTSKDTPSDLLKGHRARLRTRLEREPMAVEDYEVMELLLGYAIPRKDTKLLARQLIERFGGFRGALDARPEELMRESGFGPGLLSLWRLVREVMARYEAAPLREHEVLASPEAVAKMARLRLGGLGHEESWVALVDAQNRLKNWERVRRGGVSSVQLQPRDVLEVALLRKASGIILVHNHPGGSPEPSKADRELTREIQSLAQRLGLRFLDHVIVTEGDCYSITSGHILRQSGGK